MMEVINGVVEFIGGLGDMEIGYGGLYMFLIFIGFLLGIMAKEVYSDLCDWLDELRYGKPRRRRRTRR